MSDTEVKGLLMVQMEVAPEDVAELDAWYWEEHIPERLACPGFLSARRFQMADGSPKFVALYELDGIGALETSEYRHVIENSTARTKAVGRMATITRVEYVELHDPAPQGEPAAP
ncbi:conserved hypothetical protein [Microbacterium sp. C448]|uniref:DUF4286 family protein n=1 Tax=Microbacterium TaxID=33882 RepID=UPI0003DE4272|nr:MULTISPECIES: DUF4286 family protein [Microbacterium]CDJ99817.1 conserved hypothetical protein [Microbacterium sp. C448]